MPQSMITSKGQTTIPAKIRRELGLAPGDLLNWEIVDGTIRVDPGQLRFLKQRGLIHVGSGDVSEDIRQARSIRGTHSA